MSLIEVYESNQWAITQLSVEAGTCKPHYNQTALKTIDLQYQKMRSIQATPGGLVIGALPESKIANQLSRE